MQKILIAVTNHPSLGKKKKRTGLWLSELTDFYDEMKGRYEMTIISTKNERVPIDPKSLPSVALRKKTRDYYTDDEFMDQLKNPLTVDDIDPAEYDAIYFAGGHGAMNDFPYDDKIRDAIRTIYENGGIVSAVCHGPAALLNVKLSTGGYLLAGHRVSGFTDREEKVMGQYGHLPYSLEQAMVSRGAIFTKAKLPMGVCTVQSGRLVTGQNPASVKAVALKVAEIMERTAKNV